LKENVTNRIAEKRKMELGQRNSAVGRGKRNWQSPLVLTQSGKGGAGAAGVGTGWAGRKVGREEDPCQPRATYGNPRGSRAENWCGHVRVRSQRGGTAGRKGKRGLTKLSWCREGLWRGESRGEAQKDDPRGVQGPLE